MESARFTLFTRKTKNPKIMALPPTSPNLMLHLWRAHLQVMLLKVADHQTPPDECSNITNFGWKIGDGFPVPVTGASDPAPPQLIDVIWCQCKVQGKKCSTGTYGCHREHLLYTSYCNCCGDDDGCCNPCTKFQEVKDIEMEAVEYEREFEEDVDHDEEDE